MLTRMHLGIRILLQTQCSTLVALSVVWLKIISAVLTITITQTPMASMAYSVLTGATMVNLMAPTLRWVVQLINFHGHIVMKHSTASPTPTTPGTQQTVNGPTSESCPKSVILMVISLAAIECARLWMAALALISTLVFGIKLSGHPTSHYAPTPMYLHTLTFCQLTHSTSRITHYLNLLPLV